MNELYPSADLPDDPDTPEEVEKEQKIEHLMDTLGIPRKVAEERLGYGEGPATGFSRTESRQLHPSAAPRRSRGSSRPAVGEDSEDVYTGIISPEQAATNTRNWTEIKQKLHAAALAKMTPEEQRQFNIDEQAKADRQRRGY